MKNSEGQSFCNAGDKLPEPDFGYGMIYVGLTEATVMKILRCLMKTCNIEGRLCQTIEHLLRIMS